MPDPEPLIPLRLTLSTPAAIEPDEITRRVGVTPSLTWRVGDPLGRVTGRPGQRVTTDSGWQLKIGPRRTIDMPSLFAELIKLVAPRLDAIEATVAELALAVNVGLHVKMVDQAPVGTIDHQTLALLARLHAELDLDLYVVDADTTNHSSKARPPDTRYVPFQCVTGATMQRCKWSPSLAALCGGDSCSRSRSHRSWTRL